MRLSHLKASELPDQIGEARLESHSTQIAAVLLFGLLGVLLSTFASPKVGYEPAGTVLGLDSPEFWSYCKLFRSEKEQVTSACYSSPDRFMMATFGDRRLGYCDVPKEIMDTFIAAASPTIYFSNEIRNDTTNGRFSCVGKIIPPITF